LSVTVIAPVLPPVAVGVKVTFSEQVASDASVPPQLVAGTVTTAKSPEATTEVMVSAPEPVLVRMMLLAVDVVDSVWSPKFRLVGFKLTPGACATPVPVMATDCGDPVALSVNASVAFLVPAAVGVNVTLAVQFNPESNNDGQLSVKL